MGRVTETRRRYYGNVYIAKEKIYSNGRRKTKLI